MAITLISAVLSTIGNKKLTLIFIGQKRRWLTQSRSANSGSFTFPNILLHLALGVISS